MQKQVSDATKTKQSTQSPIMCINVDWLQVYTLCHPIEPGFIAIDGAKYKIVLEDGQTPLFTRVLRVVSAQGRRCAIILQEPRNKVINERSTMIKLENRMLYSEGFVAYLYGLMSAIGATYKGITRLDLCCDSNKMGNGMSYQRFIKRFIQGVEGVKGDIVRVGSNKFFIVGSKDNVSTCTINSIRFGSFKSKIGAYIYNKPLELREVKDKPWIRKVWEQAGLTNTDDCPVWRAEISISCEGTDVLNMGTGELFRLSPRFLQYKDSIERLFRIYASKALHFRECTGQKARRHYKDMNLWGGAEMTSRPYSFSKFADTGRTEKVCANKLKSLLEEYSDLAGHEIVGVQAAIKLLLEIGGIKHATAQAKTNKMLLDGFRGYKFKAMLHQDYARALQEVIDARADFTHNDLDEAWQILTVYGVAEPIDTDEAYWRSLAKLAEH